jgi:hypothetical protein
MRWQVGSDPGPSFDLARSWAPALVANIHGERGALITIPQAPLVGLSATLQEQHLPLSRHQSAAWILAALLVVGPDAPPA